MSRQQIYCVTFAKLNCKGETVDVDHEYQHADSSRQAEFNFRVAHGEALAKGAMKIVAVGVALGAFVDEKTGELSL